MPEPIDLDTFFDDEFELTTPATIYGNDGVEVNLAVIFERDAVVQPLGDSEVSTAIPTAEARSSGIDLPRCLNAAISIQSQLSLQDGTPLLYQDGTPVIVGVYKYYIVDIRRQVDGTSLLILSEDQP